MHVTSCDSDLKNNLVDKSACGCVSTMYTLQYTVYLQSYYIFALFTDGKQKGQWHLQHRKTRCHSCQVPEHISFQLSNSAA